MADNIGVRPSTTTGSVTVATDDIDGVHYPIYKQSYGADGEQTPVSINNRLPVSLGYGHLTHDAWGIQKVTQAVSLFHGMFSFDVPPNIWLVEEDGAEVVPASVTSCTSSGGALHIDPTGFTTVEMHSHRHPRYQPNRGHLYSTAVFLPSPNADCVRDFGLISHDENGVFFRLIGNGASYTLNAVRTSGSVETVEEITIPSAFVGFDISKGNIYDIQFQWRGVGNYKFYIGNPATGLSELVHTMNLLGTLDALSIQNPTLPATFKVDNTNGGNGKIICGCVDITSEGGTEDREQYQSATHARSTGTNTEIPILSIFSPETINGHVNTRDTRLARVSGSADAKVTCTVYKTRDPAALTGEAFATIGGGTYVQKDTTATAIVTANANKILSFKIEANSSAFRESPDPRRIDFFVSHGDYIIITSQGNNTNVDFAIEWGEEI